MFSSIARKRRQPLRGKSLTLESLEVRLALASPQSDSYSTTEDIPFQTGKVGVTLRAPGWRTFDDLTNAANVYPTNTTQAGVPWHSDDYIVDSNQSFGNWDAARAAPFQSPANSITRFNNDGTPGNTVDAPSSSEATFLARNTFDLPAGAIGLDTAGGQILCDDACVVYLNGIEIYRLRLDAGPVVPNQLATGGTAGNERREHQPFMARVRRSERFGYRLLRCLCVRERWFLLASHPAHDEHVDYFQRISWIHLCLL